MSLSEEELIALFALGIVGQQNGANAPGSSSRSSSPTGSRSSSPSSGSSSRSSSPGSGSSSPSPSPPPTPKSPRPNLGGAARSSNPSSSPRPSPPAGADGAGADGNVSALSLPKRTVVDRLRNAARALSKSPLGKGMRSAAKGVRNALRFISPRKKKPQVEDALETKDDTPSTPARRRLEMSRPPLTPQPPTDNETMLRQEIQGLRRQLYRVLIQNQEARNQRKILRDNTRKAEDSIVRIVHDQMNEAGEWVTQFRKDNERLEKENQRLRQEQEKLDREIETRAAEGGNLSENDFNLLLGVLGNLTEDLSNKVRKIASLKEDRNFWKKRVFENASVYQDNAELQSNMKTLQENLETLSIANESLEREKLDLGELIEAYKNKVQRGIYLANSREKELGEQFQQKDKTIKILEGNLDKIKASALAKIKELENELETSRSNTGSDMQRLQRENKLFEQRIQGLEGDLEKVKGDLRQARSEAKKSAEELKKIGVASEGLQSATRRSTGKTTPVPKNKLMMLNNTPERSSPIQQLRQAFQRKKSTREKGSEEERARLLKPRADDDSQDELTANEKAARAKKLRARATRARLKETEEARAERQRAERAADLTRADNLSNVLPPGTKRERKPPKRDLQPLRF